MIGTCAHNILLVVWFGVSLSTLQGDLFEIHLYSLPLSASSHSTLGEGVISRDYCLVSLFSHPQ